MDSEHDKIYLTYGALHYEGVLEKLRGLQQSQDVSDGEVVIQTWGVLDSRQLQAIH